MKRKRPKLNKSIGVSGGLYFDRQTPIACISSGCRLLDRVLGGGWAEGRVANLVGDKSTGKSLLAIEACANFAIKRPLGLIRYAETEDAFDIPYAQNIGLPLERVDMNDKGDPIDTVEDWYKDLDAFVKRVETHPKKNVGGLYILDSLDAIGDLDEKEAEFGKDSYGAKKPKLIGQLFRRIIRRLGAANITMLIISQTRDKIGISFGDKLTRSGGKALDFYSSQIVWLSDLGKMEETKSKVKRKVGAWIRAKCKKNKVGLAWRECDFPLRYAYGVDDMDAALTWLESVSMLDRAGLSKEGAKKWLKALDEMEPEEVTAACNKMNEVLDECWFEVERRFLPKRSKYGSI